jgi:hypothetical protein
VGGIGGQSHLFRVADFEDDGHGRGVGAQKNPCR